MMTFQFYTRYTFSFPVGMISLYGINAVRLLIARSNVGTSEKPVYLASLPEDWDWRWLVSGRAQYVGTFPKRVWKFYYRTQGVKLPDSLTAEIGNLARAHTEDNACYTFEFVNRIDWRAGDFGDSGSCYWGSRTGARAMLIDNGGFAVRFYDGDTGKGRAWMYQIEQGVYVLWNGYGFLSDSTLTIARVIASFWGVTYKRIDLSNWGIDDGTLYINSGRGYLIGTHEAVEGVGGSYDFQWGEQEYYDGCANCGRGLAEDEGYYAPDDQTYCESCYYELFDSCDICGETYEREYVTFVESTHETVCEDCLNERFTMCEDCEEYYPNDEIHERSGLYYCERHVPPEDEE